MTSISKKRGVFNELSRFFPMILPIFAYDELYTTNK